MERIDYVKLQIQSRITPTTVTEEDRKKDQSVQGTKQHNTEIHPEVEDLEELRLGKRQNNDTKEFCKCNSTQHLSTMTKAAIRQF